MVLGDTKLNEFDEAILRERDVTQQALGKCQNTQTLSRLTNSHPLDLLTNKHMNNPTCAVCGAEMRFVKAGVSKTTGKPYDGFWACPDRHQQPKKQGYSSQVVQQRQVTQGQSDTDKKIRWMNSLNNATLLMANGKITKDQFRLTAEWLYGLEPTEVKPEALKFDDVPTINIDEPGEEPVNLDSIPF